MKILNPPLNYHQVMHSVAFWQGRSAEVYIRRGFNETNRENWVNARARGGSREAPPLAVVFTRGLLVSSKSLRGVENNLRHEALSKGYAQRRLDD